MNVFRGLAWIAFFVWRDVDPGAFQAIADGRFQVFGIRCGFPHYVMVGGEPI